MATNTLSCVVDASTPVAVTAIGALTSDDWATYGDAGSPYTTPKNTKSGGGATISLTANNTVADFSPVSVTKSWTGGTPDASGSDAYTIYCNYVSGGSYFEFVFPADTTERKARIWMSANMVAATTVTSTLSGGGTSPQVDNTTFATPGGQVYGYIDVVYEAASAAQTLTVRFETPSGDGGNVAVVAAAWAFTSAPPATSPPSRLLTLGVG